MLRFTVINNNEDEQVFWSIEETRQYLVNDLGVRAEYLDKVLKDFKKEEPKDIYISIGLYVRVKKIQ